MDQWTAAPAAPAPPCGDAIQCLENLSTESGRREQGPGRGSAPRPPGSESAAVRLPSQFLLVLVVGLQGCVDEELIEDVPLEENEQNKRKPVSKRLHLAPLGRPSPLPAVDCAHGAGQPSSGTNFDVPKNTDCWRSRQHPERGFIIHVCAAHCRSPHRALCLHTGSFQPFHTAALPPWPVSQRRFLSYSPGRGDNGAV